MRFKVLKSSLDGISGGQSSYTSIKEVLREIIWYKGWDSREQLHESIRKWSENCQPGSVFTTQVTAIIAVGIESGIRVDDECTECGHEGLDYQDLDPVEDGGIQQEVSCPGCGLHWMDKFVLVDRKELPKHKA